MVEIANRQHRVWRTSGRSIEETHGEKLALLRHEAAYQFLIVTFSSIILFSPIIIGPQSASNFALMIKWFR